MKLFPYLLLAFTLVPITVVAQQSGDNAPEENDKNQRQTVELQKEVKAAESKIEKANATKPEQNLHPPEQSLGQRLENGKWTRKDAKGKSDEQIMKEQAKEIVKDLVENGKPPSLVDAGKAAARASTPSSAQAPTAGPEHLTFAQRQEVQKQMEKMYQPYMKAQVDADRASAAAAQAVRDHLAQQAAADRAAAAAAAARPTIRPDYSSPRQDDPEKRDDSSETCPPVCITH